MAKKIESIDEELTGVVICGGGPTGVALSTMLTQLQVPHIILERELEVTTDPRGIALDEDGIRALQIAGIYDKMYTEIGAPFIKFQFISGVHTNLHKKPLVNFDFGTSDGGTGHIGYITHKQPALETAIREKIATSEYGCLRGGAEVVGVSEEDDDVVVTWTDKNEKVGKIRANFLVGCDGKKGYVRKMYLEPKGVIMEGLRGASYQETWIAMNWNITIPTPETHPDFPLWQLGYTPMQVYDAFFPPDFRFMCNPKRPSVSGRFGLPEDRLWRIEFVVQREENPVLMCKKEETDKIVMPYLTHPKSRYGLDQDVQYPEDCLKCLRSGPFKFTARNCNNWSLGRVVLAGDAAHEFPPFGGQGIASGIRDSLGLAWRLALLYRRRDISHDRLLEAWYTERKQQLEASLATTVHNGEILTESNPIKILMRDWTFWALQLVPSWRKEIRKGPRAGGRLQYKHKPGFPFVPQAVGGALFPQAYTFDFRQNKIVFSDDLIFSSANTKGLFKVLLLPASVTEIGSLLQMLNGIDEASGGLICADEANILLQGLHFQNPLPMQTLKPTQSIARLATGVEFGASPLCIGRPQPINYDPFHMRDVAKGKQIIILRPDRFVYAACANTDELAHALSYLPTALHMPKLQ